jgi:adenylate cyclase
VPLRVKILALTVLLLAVFAVTTALSAYLIRDVMEEMGGIVDYHITLTALISELDVLTFEYELDARRLVDGGHGDPATMKALVQRQARAAERLGEISTEAHGLLERAVSDPRNDPSDRIVLARVDGGFDLLGRQIPPFIAVGRGVLADVQAGRGREAQQSLAGFARFEQAFGDDLARIRRSISELTRDSTHETEGQAGGILLMNGILFLLAASTGLAVFTLLAYRLQQAFRTLLEGTRSVEAGELDVELPVKSRDEIGQLTVAFNRMVGELRSKEKIKDTFGKFLDPRIVASLLRAQSEEDGDTAERRTVTVFFSDIQGFSGLSEQLTADVMVRLLNGYFSTVTGVIRQHNGIVDKYIGDAVMSFWSPPFSRADKHATDACLAALAQQAAIVEFKRELSNLTGLRRNVPPFAVRMGLATGEVVIGTIGSEAIKSYTVIGDVVNLASRLEGVNKAYGTSIVVAEDTYRLAQDAVEARELDLLVVVGKTEPIRVFELLGPTGRLSSTMAELRGVFAEGLLAYRERTWDVAERKFRECLQIAPEDGPARTFVERVTELRARPPAASWNGVWGMHSK